MLPFQPFQPHYLLWSSVMRLRLFGQRQVVGGMRHARDLFLPAGAQALQAILTDRLKHHKAWLLVTLLTLLQQALVNEGGYIDKSLLQQSEQRSEEHTSELQS